VGALATQTPLMIAGIDMHHCKIIVDADAATARATRWISYIRKNV
jgi:hypothetical protein